MSWYALDVSSPVAERDAVAAWLVEQTGQAVEEREDGTLVGAAASREAAGTLARELRSVFGKRVRCAARPLPEVDWRLSWRAGLGPRRIGRLLVAPSWSDLVTEGPSVILDPETAFGTGEHGSTRTALLLLDRLLRPGDRVLDLGSGSGILAIAAAELGAARATGVDVDPETEAIARANAEHNGVGERVRFLTGDAGVLAPLLGPVELVLSNILRAQNEALLPAIGAALGPGGTAIFAGMEVPEQPEFHAALERAGWRAIAHEVDGSWWGVAARRA